MVIHKNEWKWGKSFDFIADDGTATISMSITDDEPLQAFFSGLSVCERYRKRRRGTRCLECAIERARLEGCKYAYLMADMNSFVFEWYKRMGFKYYGHKQDENGLVPMYIEL